MGSKIFISYRRDDSAALAGRVYDRLEREYGRDRLFMDIDAIPLGAKFAQIIKEAVEQSVVVLVIIGPRWLCAVDENGTRRLDDPNDFVRLEIATALRNNIFLIPLISDGAQFPSLELLPLELHELTAHNGLYVRHLSFHADLDKLVDQITDKISLSEPSIGAEAEATSSLHEVIPRASNSAGVPKDVLARIKTEAARQNPDDFSTQLYVIQRSEERRVGKEC